MSDIIVPPQINFSRYSKSTPKYNYLKVQIDNQASSTVSLTPTTNPRIDFRLPASVINLAKSYLSFTISQVSAVANSYAVLEDDAIAVVENVQVGYGSNADLQNITSVQNWTKIWNPIAHSFDEFQRNNQDSYFHTCPESHLNQAILNNAGSAIQILVSGGSTTIKTAPTDVSPGVAPVANVYGYTYTPNANNKTQYVAVSGAVPTINPISFNEPQHVIIPADAGVASGKIHKRVPLNQLGGFLSTDKDIFTGNDMYLRLTMSNTKKLGHVVAPSSATTTAAFNQTISLANVYLYIAIEANNEIAGAVLEQYRNGGLQFEVEQIVPFFTTLPATTSCNQQYTINRSFGRYLKFALTTFMHADELNGDGNEYNNQNVDGAKVNWYRTSINGSYLQPENIYCYDPVSTSLNGDELLVCDWVRDTLQNSAYQHDGTYLANFALIDNFANCMDMPDLGIKKSDVACGLDLDGLNNNNLVYQMQLKTNGTALKAYTFFVFSRKCTISPAGIMLE